MAKPSILSRAKIAYSIFKDGFPSRRNAGKFAKAAAIAWPTLADEKPAWHIIDYGNYVEEGFNLNSLIYSAVMYKYRALSSVKPRACTGDRDHPERVEESDHPLVRLLDRPNPHQTWNELQGQADAFLNISGNAYFWLVRKKRKGLPEAIYCPRPDRVFVVPKAAAKLGKGKRPQLTGYKYVPEGTRKEGGGISILPQDMMHIKLPNPGDPLNGLGEGLSPISPAAQCADIDNSVTRFIKLFWERGGVPPYWFLFDVSLDDAAVKTLRQRVQEIYGGMEGWTKHGVLDRGGTLERVGLTFEEMGFEGLDERNESRILGPFGVPPVLIGTRFGLARSTLANYAEARRHFWEDTMIPELGLFEQEYQYYLKSDDGAFVMFDYSGVPALQKDIPVLVEAAHKMWSMGVPANTAFETVGMDVEDVPAGDEGFVPLAVMPVGKTGQVMGEPVPPTTETGGPAPTEEGAVEAEEDERKTAKKVQAR